MSALSQRILMAPGPSNLHPRVVQALIAPLTGHKDPTFLEVMDETAELLRSVFQTRNAATFALPATGGSGMEAALVNLLEPGDTVLFARGGFFADRWVSVAKRLAVEAVVVDAPWGKAVELDQLTDAIRRHRPRVVAVVHGETSTGVEQPLEGLGDVCRENDALLAIDAVASLGGTPLPIDALGIDLCYGGSQKCLSAPPGTAPITVSDRAMRVIANRRTPVASWYFDLVLHAGLWGTEHTYHHTSPVLNVYALREALRLVCEEGLEARFERHRLHAMALCHGLEALGLEMFAQPEHRLVPVTTVLAPEGVSSARVRDVLLQEFNIEIAAGLGEYAEGMWRVGIMGHSAQQSNVLLLLTALEYALRRQGYAPPKPGAAVAAAEAAYARAA
jgi:alanine-glyoxylate transaminase / serine-glyoxylate transaminase / serine-pyruvate transaminase